ARRRPLSNESSDPRPAADDPHPAGSRLPTATVAGSGKRPYKRRFSNFLLNKSLQLRYIGVVTVISAVLLGTLGTMIWQQKNLASSQILEALETSEVADPTIKAAIDQALSREDTNWVLRLAGVGVGLVFALFFLLLVMTHKVAGPLYKVSLYFAKMAQGRLGETYPLRRGDMLQDFYDDFCSMHKAVRDSHRADNEAIGRYLAACDAAGVERLGAVAQLADHHQARHEALS
ncbi:MAG: hypothetical protein AAGC55_29340, partial [Myxococcota bacterium]